MAWVYRYRDVYDIVRYIGIVWGEDRSLDQRINEHQTDWWYKESPYWVIDYMEENIPNRATAEALESHYISKYNTGYKTGNGYNQAKEGWGTISFLSNVKEDWKGYSSPIDPNYIDHSDVSGDRILNWGDQHPLSHRDRSRARATIGELERDENSLHHGHIPYFYGYKYTRYSYEYDVNHACDKDNYDFWFGWIERKLDPLNKLFASWAEFYDRYHSKEYEPVKESPSLWTGRRLLYLEPSPDNDKCPIFRSILLVDGCREERYADKPYCKPKDFLDSRGGSTVYHMSPDFFKLKADNGNFEKSQCEYILSLFSPLVEKYKETYKQAEESRIKVLNRLTNEYKKQILQNDL